eukprot:5040327-Amphidinium_carterae.2
MHNKCLRCGSEEHLVKSCPRATRKREARAAQAEEDIEDPEADEPEQEDDDPDAAQDEPEDEEEFEEVDDTELDPENDEYDIVDPDDYSIETVDANAMNKGKGRGRGQGSGGKGRGRGRRPSSRGRAPKEREPDDPFRDLDPRNPPHPSSQLGQNVIRRANQLRKELIGRQKANMGYHHDSSPSEAHSDLTSDEDFNEHPELAH